MTVSGDFHGLARVGNSGSEPAVAGRGYRASFDGGVLLHSFVDAIDMVGHSDRRGRRYRVEPYDMVPV